MKPRPPSTAVSATASLGQPVGREALPSCGRRRKRSIATLPTPSASHS